MDTSIIFTFVAVEEKNGGFAVYRLNGFPKAPHAILCESKEEAKSKAKELAEKVMKDMGGRIDYCEIPIKHFSQFQKHLLGKVNLVCMPITVFAGKAGG